MKKKLLKGILISSAMTLLFACNQKKEESAAASDADKEQVKKEIQAKENEYAEVYNSGKLKDIGYYADDATVFAENKNPLKGKESIIAYLKAGEDSSSKGNTISFTTNEVFLSNDGVHVVEIGYYKLVDSTQTPINTGNYMVLFEKRDGKFVCIREMSTSDMNE